MQWVENVTTKKLINVVITTKSTTHEEVINDLVQD
jgi:hypothetical protein